MPSRNIVKQYGADTYYHLYNRGVEKRKIFLEDADYAVFLNLFKRYLDDKPTEDSSGREYDWLAEDIQIVTFCLMPNHFHLLIFQTESTAMTRLMRAVCTSYTMYFNKKYNRVGKLFQGHFKASIIQNETYLSYITRYIHRNPLNYLNWKWSSLPYWLDKKHAEWVHPELLKDVSSEQYLRFIKDDEDSISVLDKLSDILADR